jgi:hypothetical protein
MTSFAIAGQQQQRPVAREGGMYKREWFGEAQFVGSGGQSPGVGSRSHAQPRSRVFASKNVKWAPRLRLRARAAASRSSISTISAN